MDVYLVRHAEAVERAAGLNDEVRWLTPKGRKSMKKVACRLRKMQIQPGLIITSPLTRAVQTSELLMSKADKNTILEASSQLVPEAAENQLVELIRSSKSESIMLVGHEPLLSRTAAMLLHKENLPGVTKGSCLSLELPENQAKPAKFVCYISRGGRVITSLDKFLRESAV